MGSRLVMVEDHGLIAETVSSALRSRGHHVHVVDARGIDDIVGAVVAVDPDLVLLDLDLGAGRDALEVLPELVRDGTPVVMVTGVTDPVRLARCVRAGAVGIVDKGQAFDQLIGAVTEALEHERLLTPHQREEHLDVLRRHEAQERERLAPFERLSGREADVLRALSRGRSVEEVARANHLALTTVRTHVRGILRKLGVSSQLAATALARESGWLDADA